MKYDYPSELLDCIDEQVLSLAEIKYISVVQTHNYFLTLNTINSELLI